jgi:hypothetical protein
MYHYVVTAHQGGRRLQTPVSGKYHYLFGEHLLIAPIYKDDLTNEIHLPAGKWRYWFDDRKIIDGPVTFSREFPLEEYPVFIKEGAIIPMDVKRSYTGIGSAEDEGFLTFLIYPDSEKASFEVFREYDKSTILSYSRKDREIALDIQGKKCPHILNIASEDSPSIILLDGHELIPGLDFEYFPETSRLRIKTSEYENGNYIISF